MGKTLGKLPSLLTSPFYRNFTGPEREMALDTAAVAKIAHLARLEIDAGDVPGYARNLSDILDFVEQLNAVDTHGVIPLAHPLDTAQRMRPDLVTETDQRENYQSIAPQTQAGLFLVPKVIE